MNSDIESWIVMRMSNFEGVEYEKALSAARGKKRRCGHNPEWG